MSVQSLSLVFEHSVSEGAARLVLLSIANHDGEGGSWPSIATIGKEAKKSESTVRRAIKDLEDLGELVVHRNDGGTHKTRADRRPNRYEITIDPGIEDETEAVEDPSETPGDGVSPMTPRDGTRPVTDDTPSESDGVSSQTARGVTDDTRTVLNHPYPPSPSELGEIDGCTSHPGGRANCRQCGTTPRQIAKAARKRADAEARAATAAAEAERRAAEAAAIAERDPARTRAALESAKQAIADNRRAAQEAS